MRFLATLCCVLVVSACKEELTGPTPPLNSDFTLAPRQVATIDSTDATIQFHRVLSDSRCPADVTCVRAGEAIVLITVKSPRGVQDYELRSDAREPTQHHDLTIRLREVSPYPVSTQTIGADDYRATFRVARP
jgi:hypothetical protein